MAAAATFRLTLDHLLAHNPLPVGPHIASLHLRTSTQGPGHTGARLWRRRVLPCVWFHHTDKGVRVSLARSPNAPSSVELTTVDGRTKTVDVQGLKVKDITRKVAQAQQELA